MDINDPLFPKESDSFPLSKNKCFICEKEYEFIGEKFIWGNGNKNGNIMIIGKDSAIPKKKSKDKLWTGSVCTGMPLTNVRTGKRFRNFLKEAGFNLSDIFITNSVKCNDSIISKILSAFTELPRFMKLSKKCSYYIDQEIRRVMPGFIITLGDAKYPVEELLDKNEKEVELNISNIDISQFKEQKCPFRGKFANGVSSEIYNLWHPSRVNVFKYINNLKAIANHINIII